MAAQKVSLHKETATKTMAHNDRTLYKEDYFKDAETPEHWTPFGDGVTVAESEMRIYRKLFGDALMAQNERALAMYKPERVMTMEQWHEKHMPQEIVFGVGNAENPGTIEEAGLLAWRLKEIVEASGGTVISIDLHRERMFDDEDDVAAIRRGDKTVEECPYVVGSGHGHMRVVWAHEGKVDVANTLEAHGFLREKPDQKRTKRNNESKTFTAFARTSLEDYAEHTLGLEIDRTRDKGAASLSPRDYANMKQAVRKMQEREQQADIAIEAAREAARHDMAHSMFMAEIAAEQDAQMIRDAVLVDAEEEADRIREEARVDAEAEREDAARSASQAQEEAETARREAEAARAARDEAQRQSEAAVAYARETRRLAETEADETRRKAEDDAFAIRADAHRDASQTAMEAMAQIAEREDAADAARRDFEDAAEVLRNEVPRVSAGGKIYDVREVITAFLDAVEKRIAPKVRVKGTVETFEDEPGVVYQNGKRVEPTYANKTEEWLHKHFKSLRRDFFEPAIKAVERRLSPWHQVKSHPKVKRAQQRAKSPISQNAPQARRYTGHGGLGS